MTEKDFNAYMSGECVPANTWQSALMICEVKLFYVANRFFYHKLKIARRRS